MIKSNGLLPAFDPVVRMTTKPITDWESFGHATPRPIPITLCSPCAGRGRAPELADASGTGSPTRMSLWDPASKAWTYLTSAGALFSTNTICCNGRDLCVVNANDLNSVVEEHPQTTEGRDLIRVRFGADGRVDLSCYDDACEEVNG